MRATADLAGTHDYGFEVPARSRRGLTQDAHIIHVLAGYKGYGPFPIMRFMEHVLPVVCDGFEFVVEAADLMGARFGLTFPEKRIIVLREDVYNAAVDGGAFARMTVAHEVGHLLEHGDVPLAMALRRADERMPAYRSSEWQANAFAGALLMPACRIVNMQPDEVAEVYGVSMSAARVQTEAIRGEARRWELPQL